MEPCADARLLCSFFEYFYRLFVLLNGVGSCFLALYLCVKSLRDISNSGSANEPRNAYKTTLLFQSMLVFVSAILHLVNMKVYSFSDEPVTFLYHYVNISVASWFNSVVSLLNCVNRLTIVTLFMIRYTSLVKPLRVTLYRNIAGSTFIIYLPLLAYTSNFDFQPVEYKFFTGLGNPPNGIFLVPVLKTEKFWRGLLACVLLILEISLDIFIIFICYRRIMRFLMKHGTSNRTKSMHSTVSKALSIQVIFLVTHLVYNLAERRVICPLIVRIFPDFLAHAFKVCLCCFDQWKFVILCYVIRESIVGFAKKKEIDQGERVRFQNRREIVFSSLDPRRSTTVL